MFALTIQYLLTKFLKLCGPDSLTVIGNIITPSHCFERALKNAGQTFEVPSLRATLSLGIRSRAQPNVAVFTNVMKYFEWGVEAVRHFSMKY